MPTTYEAGVVEAMRQAGVRPDDDVVLLGHSEGGMVALNTAIHGAGGFRVTSVITAGAPVGLATDRVPPGVQVLALENDGDLVPHLDGGRNADRPEVTTVRVAHDSGTVLGNHDLRRSYVPGAADVDASDDPSVRAFLTGMDGVFDADSAETQRFLIARRYR